MNRYKMKYQRYSVKDGKVYTWVTDGFDELNIPTYAKILEMEENVKPIQVSKTISYQDFIGTTKNN